MLEQLSNIKYDTDDIGRIDTLISAINLCFDIQDPHRMRFEIQQFVIEFCYRNKISLDETLKEINKRIPVSKKIEREGIVPKSEKGREHLVKTALVHFILTEHAIGSAEQTGRIMQDFCSITGLPQGFVEPIIKDYIKRKKKEIIEKELYGTFEKVVAKEPDKKTRKAQMAEAISAYADILEVEPDYIMWVLADKKRRENVNTKKQIANGKLKDLPDHEESGNR